MHIPDLNGSLREWVVFVDRMAKTYGERMLGFNAATRSHGRSSPADVKQRGLTRDPPECSTYSARTFAPDGHNTALHGALTGMTKLYDTSPRRSIATT